MIRNVSSSASIQYPVPRVPVLGNVPADAHQVLPPHPKGSIQMPVSSFPSLGERSAAALDAASMQVAAGVRRRAQELRTIVSKQNDTIEELRKEHSKNMVAWDSKVEQLGEQLTISEMKVVRLEERLRVQSASKRARPSVARPVSVAQRDRSPSGSMPVSTQQRPVERADKNIDPARFVADYELNDFFFSLLRNLGEPNPASLPSGEDGFISYFGVVGGPTVNVRTIIQDYLTRTWCAGDKVCVNALLSRSAVLGTVLLLDICIMAAGTPAKVLRGLLLFMRGLVEHCQEDLVPYLIGLPRSTENTVGSWLADRSFLKTVTTACAAQLCSMGSEGMHDFFAKSVSKSPDESDENTVCDALALCCWFVEKIVVYAVLNDDIDAGDGRFLSDGWQIFWGGAVGGTPGASIASQRFAEASAQLLKNGAVTQSFLHLPETESVAAASALARQYVSTLAILVGSLRFSSGLGPFLGSELCVSVLLTVTRTAAAALGGEHWKDGIGLWMAVVNAGLQSEVTGGSTIPKDIPGQELYEDKGISALENVLKVLDANACDVEGGTCYGELTLALTERLCVLCMKLEDHQTGAHETVSWIHRCTNLLRLSSVALDPSKYVFGFRVRLLVAWRSLSDFMVKESVTQGSLVVGIALECKAQLLSLINVFFFEG